jgi:uncharacterized membrane protein YkvA (DUF1232 family)
MTIEITFQLSDSDLEHFRKVMKRGVEFAQSKSEEEVIQPAQDLLAELEREGTAMPDFVAERLKDLTVIIAMLKDDEWALPKDIRGRVLSSLAYFSDPDDIIPDDIPVLGYLDDAIMVQLVVAELGPEIDAYNEFCEYRIQEGKRRGDDVSREEWLSAKRQELHSRMRRRRSRRSGKRRGVTVSGSGFTIG